MSQYINGVRFGDFIFEYRYQQKKVMSALYSVIE